MPEPASLATNCTVTSLLVQPLAGAAVTRVAVNAGGVASRRIVTDDSDVSPVGFEARHVMVVPLVSALMVVGPQPVSAGVPASAAASTSHSTVTSDLYQPLKPSLPLTRTVIVGGANWSLTFTFSHRRM